MLTISKEHTEGIVFGLILLGMSLFTCILLYSGSPSTKNWLNEMMTVKSICKLSRNLLFKIFPAVSWMALSKSLLRRVHGNHNSSVLAADAVTTSDCALRQQESLSRCHCHHV